jgi:hypothetical protein
MNRPDRRFSSTACNQRRCFRLEPAINSQVAPFQILPNGIYDGRGIAMGFSAEVWALARLCCMYPVLGGLAVWYFSRADRLLQVVRARH